MPKGVYVRTKVPHGQVWPNEVLDTVQRELDGGASFGEVLKTVRRKHPNFHTTRNALIGKAARMGWRSQNRMHNETGVKQALERRKKDPRVKPQGSSLLRDENTVVGKTHGPGWKRKHKPEDIERARQGHIPQIVESAPRSSKPFADLRRGECRWPTSDDASMACGGKATVGSYCDKHAVIAYRAMPTRKRNAVIGKVQDVDRGRIDADVDATLEHFLGRPERVLGIESIGLGTYKGPGSGFEQPLIDAVLETIIDD